MESDQLSKKLVPLGIIKDHNKCLKSIRSLKKYGPRRLSNIYPIDSHRYASISSRCPVTPSTSTVGTTQPFFSTHLCAYDNPESSTPRKVEMFVPSPGTLLNVTSPSSSLYDMDKSDQNTCCGGSTAFSNPSVDSVLSDEMCGLDDNLEDSTLQNLLTPDVISTLQAVGAMNPNTDFFWSGKMENDGPLSSVSENSTDNPTLAQLNMEPDMSFVNNMLGIGQDDSKLNYSALDFLCNDISPLMSRSSSLTCLSQNFTEFPVGPVQIAGDCSRRLATVSSNSTVTVDQQKTLTSIGQSFAKNLVQGKSNFPPRALQPPIGVVAPVKKTDESQLVMAELKADQGLRKQQSPSLQKLQSQTPSLHELLSKHTNKTSIKSEPLGSAESHLDGCSDGNAQIVPTSAGGVKRSFVDIIKDEPVSPPQILRRPLVKEESTEEKWKDIESFIHNPGQEQPVKKRRRFDSGSSGHMSDDEDDSSDYGGKDDDDSDDDYSDIDADIARISPRDCESLVATGKKQKQYFWQYNVQSKGPKGTRLKLAVESPADPHVLNDFEDPVFDECNTSIAGIRHGGKARKGDGNEITPNPRKLFMIGHQLMKLNRQINACQLGSDVPTAKRNESRKEKNKLASRACRLKKKAQHEANKIKLYGLEQEHSQLNSVLRFIWPHIREGAKIILGQNKLMTFSAPSDSLTSMLDENINQTYKDRIAGNTTDYVNSVILKVESGDTNGGLNINKKSRKT
ncbi:unnamed protein product [Lymnaea stagnalis]|uniref:BZIP domain-containing protein n=1 Tax=Lymnaea stagnalis TaxID=6523 RepID=A0AAV2I3L1_LYMST